MAFLPWVKDESATEPDVSAETSAPVSAIRRSEPGAGDAERIAELSAHVARRSTTDPREADPHEADLEIDAPEEPDPEEIADRIVRGLSRKSLSIAEVEARLYTEGVAEKDALEIVERFTRFGYLDDYKMAEQLVLSLRERKKLGRSSIQQELRARKLDADAIATALDEFDGDDEYRTALELARKRLPSLRSLSDEVAERRLTGFLARRGYSGALVQRVVRETVRRPGSGVRFH
ncbi:regulatory protein RecX [Rathayibacter sp. VKM Ac-2759]|uniref:regulatory protein RecX n=1 Tax=Rathayibacter sp. VKM Ac-2759 TaxID=2609252 RepID=UPI0013190E9B|nr:regulatory protein RecX [Rathayibacter sp. VKM Ac-2759]QHC66307.1 regulatory protein RecX [Rathayibacter sp. VKM Ac-2759]